MTDQPQPRQRLKRGNLKPIRERVLEACLAKPESDELAKPARVSLVGFRREQFLEVLEPVKNDNERARHLYFGVERAGAKCDMLIQREHLLVALGELEEYETLEALPGDDQPTT